MGRSIMSFLAIGVVWAGVVSAQNIVPNGGFDSGTGIAGWGEFTGDGPPAGAGSGSWDSRDIIAGNLSSGSAQVTIGAADEAGEAYGISQCVSLPFSGPTSAMFGFRFQLPTGVLPGSKVSAQVEVWFYGGGGGCAAADLLTGAQVGKILADEDADGASWYTAEVASPHLDLTGAPGATHVMVRAYLQAAEPTAVALTSLFDGVYLYLDDLVPVLLQRLEVD